VRRSPARRRLRLNAWSSYVADLVVVFCTDRGQHRRRRLWTGSPDGVMALSEPGHADGATWRRGGGMRFRCPTCRRDVQLTPDRWELLVKGLDAAHVTEVDTSFLS
jgi:hypothetical protein